MVEPVTDAIALLRVAIGRRNANDPDASNDILFGYLQRFIQYKMKDDVKMFELFGTLSFTIDETTTDGVYTFNEIGDQSGKFVNLGITAFISVLDPIDNSISWNRLPVYQDPGEFYSIWGINNDEILIRGYPTNMLFYGDQFVFRTLPEQAYLINIYGYKYADEITSEGNLQYDYWLRYVVYGAAVDYARDYRYDSESRSMIEATFKSERKYQLTHTHNQVKHSRAEPRF